MRMAFTFAEIPGVSKQISATQAQKPRHPLLSTARGLLKEVHAT